MTSRSCATSARTPDTESITDFEPFIAMLLIGALVKRDGDCDNRNPCTKRDEHDLYMGVAINVEEGPVHAILQRGADWSASFATMNIGQAAGKLGCPPR